jgi:Co/Zn/Cd efflux system component
LTIIKTEKQNTSGHMTTDQWITIGIIMVAVILFITEWLSVDVIGLVIISLFMVSGINLRKLLKDSATTLPSP